MTAEPIFLIAFPLMKKLQEGQAEEQGTIAASACVVCMKAPKNRICIPCGHLAMCEVCSAEVKRGTCQCPICRPHIGITTRVYNV